MRVLSLFDWISCGQAALNNIVSKETHIDYFASEIEEHSIAVTQYNFPNTIQLWSVTDIDTKKLKEIGDFDILMWGSPCTNLSSSWNRTWLIFSSLDHYLQEKEKGFKQGDINNQSYLFWEYIRILNQIRPKFFLLENVVMTKENQKIITDNLFGIEPVMIDSKLLSWQSRKRLYWVGKKVGDTYQKVDISIPVNKWIALGDILLPLDKIWSEYYIKQYSPFFFNKDYLNLPIKYTKQGGGLRTRKGEKKLEIRKDDKSNCLTTVINDSLIKIAFFNNWWQADRIYSTEWKSVSLQANWGGRGGKTWMYAIEKNKEYLEKLYNNINKNNEREIVKQFKDYDWIPFFVRKPMPIECEALQTLDSKNNTIIYGNKEAKKEVCIIDKEEWIYIKDKFFIKDINNKKEWLDKYLELLENKEVEDFNNWRLKLFIKEVYWHTRYWIKNGKRIEISKSQRYKMIWNWWTQKVIEHILKYFIS